ncbi:MAG: choice-of-anchor U domain-containing protein [Thermodesulfobacteriota bacterium]|nr:choice-of-anchor U domain-containing protein [Thermodesulfobacteriota bacterium]
MHTRRQWLSYTALSLGLVVLVATSCSFAQPEPSVEMETLLFRPNYRSILFPGAPSPEIRVKIALSLDGITLDALEVTADLMRDGSTLAHKSYKPPPAKAFDLDLDISVDVPAGGYDLIIRLCRDGAAVLPPQTHPMKKLTLEEFADLTSYIDGHNRFILNGGPFFPLALFAAQQPGSGAALSGSLDEIETSPFDTLMNYSSYDGTPSEINAYLDELKNRNLNLIFSLFVDRCNDGINDPNPANTVCEIPFTIQEFKGFIGANVEASKNHPAVVAWYLNDEICPVCLDYLEAGYQEIKELDLNHPVWSVHWDPNWLIEEAHTTDAVGVDFATDQSWLADAANVTGKPMWVVPHIWNATWAEMRAMTYLAVNHGAKGLIYYCYPLDDTRWQQIKKIASEIDALRPFPLLSTHQTNDGDVERDNSKIDIQLMRENNSYYLFAVNAGNAAATSTFQINQVFRSDTVDTLFEQGREVQVNSNGVFADDFGPYEVHVYHWQGDTDKDGDGIDSSEEWGPDGDDPNYDGDGDGKADSEYADVASGLTYNNEHYVTLAVSAPATLNDCRTLANPHPGSSPASTEFPFGFLGFEVTDLEQPGDCAEVTMLLPKNADIVTYWRYGPTPCDAADHWYEFMYNNETGADIFQEPTRTRIVLHFCDGKRGDDDLAVNGKIVDVGGPASIIAAVPAVTTQAATSITSASAKLNGTVCPNGASTTYYFEYGDTTGYGSTTSGLDAGSGVEPVPVKGDVAGLKKETTYHFRLVASNSKGTDYGDDMTFTTSSGGGGGGGGCFLATAGCR